MELEGKLKAEEKKKKIKTEHEKSVEKMDFYKQIMEKTKSSVIERVLEERSNLRCIRNYEEDYKTELFNSSKGFS
jgi:hypothetical protein